MSTYTGRRGLDQRILLLTPLLALLAWAVGGLLAVKDDQTLRASVILSVLAVVSLGIFWVIARGDSQGRLLFFLLLFSFGVKLFAAWFRFQQRLLADAFTYDQAGEQIAAMLARGQWPVVGSLGDLAGTEFVRLLTGLVYLVTGVTLYGITILWAWLALLGMIFFYLAFTRAFPQGNRRLYMVLILLYPSMLLWTSSLSKDALMVLFLGMAAYGLARLQERIEYIGVWWLGLATVGMLMVRPHIAGIFAVAVAAFALLRPIRAGMLTPVIRLGGLLIFVVIAAAVVQTAAGFVRLESLAAADVQEFIEVRQARTARGGSAFERVDPWTPQGFAIAFPTVLFRPFPWEANNVFGLLAALEGLGLFLLMLFKWRTVWAAWKASPRHSYLLMILVYALLFMFFFSAISNFGIIARQRVQLYPFVFMWLTALPARRKSPEVVA